MDRLPFGTVGSGVDPRPDLKHGTRSPRGVEADLLYNVVPSAIFTVDQERTITSWNLKAAEVTGYPADEVIGRPCSVFAISPCDGRCGVLSPDVPKPIVGGECVIRRKDGAVRLARKNADLLRDADGRVVGAVESFEDITSRKRAEEALRESEARYRDLFENATDIVYTHDLEGNFTSLNRAGESIIGYSTDRDVVSLADIVVPDHLGMARDLVARMALDPSPRSCEVPVLTREGRGLLLEVNCRSIWIDGKAVGIQGIARDVTEQRQIARRTAQSLADLEAVHQTALALGCARDLDSLIRETLQGLARLAGPDDASLLILERDETGFSVTGELTGEGAIAVSPVQAPLCLLTCLVLDERQARFEEDVDRSRALRSPVMKGKVGAYAAVPLLSPERLVGILYLTYHEPRSFPMDARQLIQVVASHAAVAIANLQMFEDAKQASITDGLTRIPNHRLLMDRLDHEISRATRSGHPLSVMMIDIDDFKLVNDAHGHTVGDDLLRRVAEVLTGSLRTTDIVGRYGGDEFLALLPETNREAAQVVGERLVSATQDINFVVAPGKGKLEDRPVPIPVRLSVGISTYPHDSATRLELISLADTAMYRSKQSGGNRVISAHSTDSAFLAAQNTTFSVLEGLVNAVDAKDHYTKVHSEQVARHALRLSRTLGLSSEDRRMVRVAGLLHDVGKIGIPDRILRKPGPLNDDEREVISQHPLLGEMIIREVPHLADIIDMVRHHHERYDGAGYPRGLRGDQIPLLSRVISVADAYSAMTLDRPYRRALSREKAIAELRRCAGTQFDPAIVAAFIRSLDEGEEAPEELAEASVES